MDSPKRVRPMKYGDNERSRLIGVRFEGLDGSLVNPRDSEQGDGDEVIRPRRTPLTSPIFLSY